MEVSFQSKKIMKKTRLLFLLLLLCSGLAAQVSFTKVTDDVLVTTPSDSRSCNFVDINDDGWEDIFITNGLEDGQNNLMYINNGDGTFTALTNDPIVGDDSPSDGASFADVDNDGDLDGFVTTWHGKINYYYTNQGNGTFVHEADVAMGNTNTYSETASSNASIPP